MEENRKYFFAICTWPNSPVRAKILSRFQFVGKNNVWISQVRRVNVNNYFINILWKRLCIKSSLNSVWTFRKVSNPIWDDDFNLKSRQNPFFSPVTVKLKCPIFNIFISSFQSLKTLKAMNNPWTFYFFENMPLW